MKMLVRIIEIRVREKMEKKNNMYDENIKRTCWACKGVVS